MVSGRLQGGMLGFGEEVVRKYFHRFIVTGDRIKDDYVVYVIMCQGI
jgi:hypothetical protein